MNTARPAATLLRRVGGARRWIAVSALFGSVTVASGIGLLALSTHLVTMSELFGTAATMSMVILGVRATAITRVVSRYLDRYIGHRGTFRVLTRLRIWSYSALLTAEPLGDERRSSGDVVTALVDDVETMQDQVLRVAVPPWVATVSLAVASIALVAIEPVLAIVVVIAGLLVAVPSVVVLRRLAGSAGRTVTDLRAERMARCTEDLDALEELVAWGCSDRLASTLSAIDHRETPAERRLSQVRSRTDAVVALGSGLLVVIVAGLALRVPILDPTWIVAAPVIALALSEVLAPLLAGAERSASTDAAARRIQQLVDSHRPRPRPASVPVTACGPTPEVRLDRLTFAFDDDAPIIADASLVLPWGTTAVILAPSGTGKSTLTQLLLGLRSPTSGAVLVDGIDVRSIVHEDGPTLIAAVLQDDHLFDTTLRDNLALADDAMSGEASVESRLTVALRIAGLDEFVAERSLDAAVGPDGSSLSGGERQRVLLARALLADAPILVLDEVAEHLDRERRRAIVDAVLTARRGRTTILLAHDEDAIAVADAVFDLHDGRLRARRA